MKHAKFLFLFLWVVNAFAYTLRLQNTTADSVTIDIDLDWAGSTPYVLAAGTDTSITGVSAVTVYAFASYPSQYIAFTKYSVDGGASEYLILAADSGLTFTQQGLTSPPNPMLWIILTAGFMMGWFFLSPLDNT